MNHKNAEGSRTGDIVAILDGRAGYVAVNIQDDVFPGWHGGPTVSESYVPLMFAMPGDSFVNTDGVSITRPNGLGAGFSAGYSNELKPDGYLRNWQMGPILNEIIKQFRDK